MAFTKAGLWGPDAVLDSAGHPQPGATAAVYLSDGVTLAGLWTSSAKSVALANPTQADIHGNLHFYADPGPYVLKVTVGGTVTTLTVEVPIDPGEAAQDQDVVAAQAAAEAYADGIVAAALAASQPLDADLTAIAALATTAFGRALLILADAAALRTAAGLGTAATHASTDFDAAGTAAAAVAAVVAGAPGALDTLNELATALADDANFATTVTNALATKVIAGATSGTANQAALPAAVAHTHEMVKTDDGGVYLSTGSSWVQLVAPNGTYASLVGNPNAGSSKLYWGPALPNSPLTQLIVHDDNTPVAGRPDISTFEFAHDGSQAYILHLTEGPNMAANGPALIGLGGDHGGRCLFVNNKATGQGIVITQNDTISSSGAYGLMVNASSSVAAACWFGQGITGAKPAAIFTANVVAAAGQRLVEFYKTVTTASDTLIGFVKADTGAFVWQTQVSFQPTDVNTVPLLVVGLSGQVADLQDWNVSGSGTVAKIANNGNATFGNVIATGTLRANAAGATITLNDTAQTTDNQIIRMSVSSGQLLVTRRATTGEGNLGTYAQFSGSGTQTFPDAANIVVGTTTGTKIGTATTQKLGFFNKAPVVQPSGTPADATDLATALTLVNSLKASLVSLGLVA